MKLEGDGAGGGGGGGANEPPSPSKGDGGDGAAAAITATTTKTVLAPGEHSEVTLTFAPPAAEAYSARVDFLVNGLWTVPVDVRGEGCEMRLELADGGQQRVELGALPLHQVGARQVTLVNRSRRAVDVSFADAADALAAKAVGLGFAGSGGRGLDGVLRPRESRALEIRFAPTARIRPFSEPIVPIVNGRPRPLLQLAGACVAMEFALEMDQLSFGQAALNTRVMRRLMLQNLGDMPSTFRLDGKMVAPDFTITPLEGYLQPNEDVNLEVTFHPQRVSRDIRYERIPLYVDGQPPLALTLTGMCVEAEAEAQVVAFKTCVRQPAAQSLTVKNPSTALWRIHPVVSDENWSAPEVLEILRRRLGAVRGDLPAADDDEAGGGGRRGGEARGLGLLPAPRRLGDPAHAGGRGAAARAGGHDRRVGGGEGAEDALPQARCATGCSSRSASAWTSARPTRRRRRCCRATSTSTSPPG